MDTHRFKSWVGILFAFTILHSPLTHAQTLATLEAITARYPTLQAFLDDADGVHEYREALKAYMGESESFNPVFETFIQQITAVNKKVDGFGEKAWRPHLGWQDERLIIKGSANGTGLELDREPILEALVQIKKEAEATAGDLVKNPTAVVAAIAELKNAYQLETPEKLAAMSGRERGAYNRRLGGSETLPKISAHPAALRLSAYLLLYRLERDENIGDMLNSLDADITAQALTRLARPGTAEADGLKWPEAIPSELVNYLNYLPETALKIQAEYANGLAATQAFRQLKDPRLDPEVRAKVQAVTERGLDPHSRAIYEQWQEDAKAMRKRKVKAQLSFRESSRYFFFGLNEDPQRGTLRLKADSGTELHFIPSPRPFHAFFAGRKTGECVGGRDCENLVPKRWARAALAGTVNLFTESGDDKMEGMVGLTQLKNERDGKIYHVVDLMSRKAKSDIILLDAKNRPIKYSIFDKFVDEYHHRLPSAGMVISDGNSVSQNVAGGEVVTRSPAYLENQIVGTPAQFSPVDKMARVIAEKFPATMLNYGQGGMIYDGMKGDGTKVVRLVPSSQRRRWTKSELESQIYLTRLRGEELTTNHVVWKRARENGVILRTLKEYQAPALMQSQAVKDFIASKLHGPILQDPTTERGSEALRLAVTESLENLNKIVDEGSYASLVTSPKLINPLLKMITSKQLDVDHPAEKLLAHFATYLPQTLYPYLKVADKPASLVSAQKRILEQLTFHLGPNSFLPDWIRESGIVLEPRENLPVSTQEKSEVFTEFIASTLHAPLIRDPTNRVNLGKLIFLKSIVDAGTYARQALAPELISPLLEIARGDADSGAGTAVNLLMSFAKYAPGMLYPRFKKEFLEAKDRSVFGGLFKAVLDHHYESEWGQSLIIDILEDPRPSYAAEEASVKLRRLWGAGPSYDRLRPPQQIPSRAFTAVTMRVLRGPNEGLGAALVNAFDERPPRAMITPELVAGLDPQLFTPRFAETPPRVALAALRAYPEDTSFRSPELFAKWVDGLGSHPGWDGHVIVDSVREQYSKLLVESLERWRDPNLVTGRLIEILHESLRRKKQPGPNRNYHAEPFLSVYSQLIQTFPENLDLVSPRFMTSLRHAYLNGSITDEAFRKALWLLMTRHADVPAVRSFISDLARGGPRFKLRSNSQYLISGQFVGEILFKTLNSNPNSAALRSLALSLFEDKRARKSLNYVLSDNRFELLEPLIPPPLGRRSERHAAAQEIPIAKIRTALENKPCDKTIAELR